MKMTAGRLRQIIREEAENVKLRRAITKLTTKVMQERFDLDSIIDALADSLEQEYLPKQAARDIMEAYHDYLKSPSFKRIQALALKKYPDLPKTGLGYLTDKERNYIDRVEDARKDFADMKFIEAIKSHEELNKSLEELKISDLGTLDKILRDPTVMNWWKEEEQKRAKNPLPPSNIK